VEEGKVVPIDKPLNIQGEFHNEHGVITTPKPGLYLVSYTITVGENNQNTCSTWVLALNDGKEPIEGTQICVPESSKFATQSMIHVLIKVKDCYKDNISLINSTNERIWIEASPSPSNSNHFGSEIKNNVSTITILEVAELE
jgi:hypothetical protein